MAHPAPGKTTLALALAVGIAGAATAHAAGTAATGSTSPPAASSAAPGTTSPAASSAATGGTSSPAASASATAKASPSSAGSTTLASKDRKFLEGAAKGGMAEVQLAALATQKAGSEEVKQFAQRMLDDHGKANAELKKLAGSKGVSLPADMDAKEKRELERLQKLSGATFDREYMKHMVSDHEKDVKEFRDTAKSAKDGDVKSFAASTLPTLEQHLQLAKTTDSAARKSSSVGGTGKTS